MNRLTKRTTNGVAYMAIADTLQKVDQEIEGSKPILEGLYAIFQKLADFEDREENLELNNLYISLKSTQINDGDAMETYTTGYRNGHLNGQIELLEIILNIDIGLRSEDKNIK